MMFRDVVRRISAPTDRLARTLTDFSGIGNQVNCQSAVDSASDHFRDGYALVLRDGFYPARLLFGQLNLGANHDALR